MSAEHRAVLVVPLEVLDREESAFRQRRVHRGPGVAFAENESVSLRPTGRARVDAHDGTVEHREDVRDRQRRTDMRASAATGHLQGVQPDASGELACIHGCRAGGHSSTAYPMYGSKGRRSSLKRYRPWNSSIAAVSPGHSGLSNSSKATMAPRGMRGRKCSSATLVGSYRSKSRYSRLTTRCGCAATNSGMVFTASPRTSSTLGTWPMNRVESCN